MIFRVNSVQEALRFTYQNLKSCKSNEKRKETKNIRPLVFSVSSINLTLSFGFSCGLQHFKFQYLNHKSFGASFLYWLDFTKILPVPRASNESVLSVQRIMSQIPLAKHSPVSRSTLKNVTKRFPGSSITVTNLASSFWLFSIAS